MAAIELIYDNDCPNVAQARAQLLRAFAEAGAPATWTEWDRGDPASPAHVRAYGSPTILVDGKDVAGAEPSDGAPCCRLYRDASGAFRGVPSVEMIASALQEDGSGLASEEGRGRKAGWRTSLAALPGIGAALLPAGLCPACWPAYAGLLSSLGFGFLLKTAYLLPLTIGFLVIAVSALGFRARARRGYGPLALGASASVIMVVGKFVLAADPVMYAGIALLVAASLWNAWPRKRKDEDSCPACAPAAAASGEAGSTRTTQ